MRPGEAMRSRLQQDWAGGELLLGKEVEIEKRLRTSDPRTLQCACDGGWI